MKKKGFTLIELLAVILILGIIALIAIPTVNNILTEARRGAFSSTLTNLEKAIEEKCTTEQIKNIEITTGYTITNGEISPNVDIKGDLPDGTIEVNTNCEVSFTLSNNNFTGNKEFAGEIEITDGSSDITTVYKESILNGADPVLSDNLIPVTIANDGTVTKADLNTKWYSYAEKKWANAVILTPNGKIEDNGTILEDSIESYFVWIPRYKYKLFDMGNYDSHIASDPTESKVQMIDIVFENKNKTISTGTAVGEYHSHPAFQAFDTNGLWIGKFETSGAVNDLKIKPNMSSLLNLGVDEIFNASINYKNDNISHMMKNTEWGAVSYLTLSKYGRCTDNICEELNINNHMGFVTGYSHVAGTNQSSFTGESGSSPTITQPYNTETGYLASTTGNITGIYDMSGGACEYMAAFVNSTNASDFFQTIYQENYFDVYNVDDNITTTNFYNRILGDATGELGPFYNNGNNRPINSWYNDYVIFPNNISYSIFRGGPHNSGSEAGLGYINTYYGYGRNFVGFRLVLSK